jgi:two-component system, NarL family, response regulator LiaR
MPSLFSRHKLIISYGLALAACLLLLNWLKWHFLLLNNAFEVYIGAIALLFTGLGSWLALKLSKPKLQTIIIEKEIYHPAPAAEFLPNENMLRKTGISKREWEVLNLMACGLSNQEIARSLFLSLNTIKTHSANLFEKLDAKRRTQAIDKAKKLGLLV